LLLYQIKLKFYVTCTYSVFRAIHVHARGSVPNVLRIFHLSVGLHDYLEHINHVYSDGRMCLLETICCLSKNYVFLGPGHESMLLCCTMYIFKVTLF